MQLPVVRAHMSNSSEGTTAALCVDGNTATSCKSAGPTSFPWIAIQLGMESTNVPAYLSRVLYWGYVYAANTIGPGQIPAKWSPEYKGMIKIDHPGASTHFGKKKRSAKRWGDALGGKIRQRVFDGLPKAIHSPIRKQFSLNANFLVLLGFSQPK